MYNIPRATGTFTNGLYFWKLYIYKKKTYYAANIYYIEASHHGIGLLLVKLSDLNVNVHKILKKKTVGQVTAMASPGEKQQ